MFLKECETSSNTALFVRALNLQQQLALTTQLFKIDPTVQRAYIRVSTLDV